MHGVYRTTDTKQKHRESSAKQGYFKNQIMQGHTLTGKGQLTN